MNIVNKNYLKYRDDNKYTYDNIYNKSMKAFKISNFHYNKTLLVDNIATNAINVLSLIGKCVGFFRKNTRRTDDRQIWRL
jgi:hypothetical protein